MQFVIFRYYTSHDGFKKSKRYDFILFDIHITRCMCEYVTKIIHFTLLVRILSDSIGSNPFDKTFMYM